MSVGDEWSRRGAASKIGATVAILSMAVAVSFTGTAGAVAGPTPESVTVVAPALVVTDVTAGPDGNVWFTTQQGPAPVGRVSPTGAMTFIPVTGVKEATDITSGPDGNVWFSSSYANVIGRVTIAGAVTLFDVPPGTLPGSLTAGPDGNVWFTSQLAIGRITPAGVTTMFSNPWMAYPKDIVAGPDGNLWFIRDAATEPIARITPAGVMTPFPYGGAPFATGRSITAGPDGNIWFGSSGKTVGRMTLTGTYTTWQLGTPSEAYVSDVVAGPDGALWFAVQVPSGSKRVARFTVDGVETDFVASAFEQPAAITAGADGRLWLANEHSIGRLATSGAYGIFRGETARAPWTLTAGADGNMWYADRTNSGIGRVTPAGVVTTFTAPGIVAPEGITKGPDGNVWFTSKNAIGRITPSGTVSTYTGTGVTGVRAIVAGPDGNLWFTNAGSNSIGRATPAGAITTFTGAAVAAPLGIAVGPDGALWFANEGNDTIGRVTTGGVLSSFPLPLDVHLPRFITAGPDGNLWFTTSTVVGRMTPAGAVTTFVGPYGPLFAVGKMIVAAPDGFLYASMQSGSFGVVVRIAMDGTMSLLINEAFRPTFGLAIGADLDLWFANTSAGTGGVGKVSLGPPPVRDVRAINGDRQATVTWTAPTASAWSVTGYRVTPVVRGVVQAPRTFPASARSAVMSGLTNGDPVTFEVVALRSNGASIPRTTASIKIGAPLAPGFPTAAPGNGSATISWYPPAPNGAPVSWYYIVAFDGPDAVASWTFDAESLSQVVTGLWNGRTYTFQIFASNGRGYGAPAITGAVTVGAPTAPAAVSATAGAGQATVTWTAPSPNASAITGYRVTPYRNGFAQPVQVFASTATTQVVTGLAPGAPYVFRVAATNGSGTGPLSPASATIVPT